MPTNQKIFLPKMGCGTWAWGNRLLWGYDESMDEELQAAFNLCVNNGVTLFDTGDSYGIFPNNIKVQIKTVFVLRLNLLLILGD
jgi:aryl-alcohol dehydrogenase-like predicted oxidoreductase